MVEVQTVSPIHFIWPYWEEQVTVKVFTRVLPVANEHFLQLTMRIPFTKGTMDAILTLQPLEEKQKSSHSI